MKKIFASPDPLAVHAVNGFLETHGIKACVLGQHRLSTAGLIPLTDCWMEVQIFDDALEDQALELVRQFNEDKPGAAASWRCPACGEELSEQSTDCWRCAAAPPADDQYAGPIVRLRSAWAAGLSVLQAAMQRIVRRRR